MKARGIRRLGRLLPGDPAEIGGYELVGRVGSGGMGTVYAGKAPGIRGYLAIKVINGEHAAAPEFRRQFAYEARLLARVNSPCVARFVQADVEADPPWMATEYVPGPTVRHHVERHGPLRGGMLVGLAAGAAEALRAVHTVGIVHRDLKPSNVVVAPQGPKILDFGIARPTAPEDATRWIRVRRFREGLRRLRLPAPGGLPGADDSGAAPRDRVGTPGWISPEQYRGGAATDRSDVFLWGCLVAFAAAARNPFGHGHPKELARRVLREEPDLDRLPGELEGLVLAALAKDPAERPDSTALLGAVLAAAGETTAAPTAVALRELLGARWTEVAVQPPRPPREGPRLWPLG
ncbi:serine/threonine-protein kinase [Streptomonospora litoralis]|uniref:Serine/threonine-protein kinase AfsK n=1 Tax=Streptomonospora litoralis TaxID=2498135 RepID=A0A4P6PXX0_9ACTN|nr:serine/threonine-protein kinase [Streptomonospora litoralis]QBI52540.1 Serine/threonine-protein kinase AfsK [Streptomonospora litoralis]